MPLRYLLQFVRAKKIEEDSVTEIISDGRKIRCHNHVEIARNISEFVFSSDTMVNQILRDNCHDRRNFSVENAISLWLATSFVRRVWRDKGVGGERAIPPHGAGWDYCRTCRPVWTWRNCPWETLTFHFQSWQRAVGGATICIPLVVRVFRRSILLY